jgi:predicted TIM-barrel fold metal-dependent hydrolase
MDRMGVDIQVVFPTTLINPVTENSGVELAWCRTYNRWMADRCAASNGRLRWIVVPPLQSMDKAIEELQFGKDHGACGVLKAGSEQAGYWPAEPYFYPMYEQAERLDMPICFHVGTGTPIIHRAPLGAVTFRSAATVMHAFASLADLHVPAQFPKLRWGFVEAFSGWVPFMTYWLSQRANARGETPPSDWLAANRFYVTCQEDEDLESIMKAAGEDHLMIGSDYTHNDFSVQQNFVTGLQERVSRGEISPAVARKITADNPTTFYAVG